MRRTPLLLVLLLALPGYVLSQTTYYVATNGSGGGLYAAGGSAGVKGKEQGATWRQTAIEDGILKEGD